MAAKALFQVSENSVSEILKIFGRNEETFKDDVSRFRKWMESQPHLPEVSDTKILENFLLLNKLSVENAKQKIDLYYTVKSSLKEIYSSMHPDLPNMKQFRDIAYVVAHPRLTEENYRLCFIKLRKKELVHKADPYCMARQLINIQELRLKYDTTYSEIFIVDAADATPFLLKATPMFLFQAFVLIYQRVFSLRVKKAYFVNSPPLLEKLFNLVKTFMKSKVFERVHFCSMEKVQKEIPEKLLPPEFGGSGLSLEELNELLDAAFEENREYLDNVSKLTANERLRPEQLKNDEFLGYHGSFQKLEID